MIVARAIGLSRAEIFEAPIAGFGRPEAEDRGVSPVGVDEVGWVHRGAFAVHLLPVEAPRVRLGPTLRPRRSRLPLPA